MRATPIENMKSRLPNDSKSTAVVHAKLNPNQSPIDTPGAPTPQQVCSIV